MLPPKFVLQKIHISWCYSSNVKAAHASAEFLSKPEAKTQENKFNMYIKELRHQRELS
jgi:hypothetical protein